MMSARFYAVTCKHGHHGARRYEPITFAIRADNALEACDKAKLMPGVKHDQSVLACKEITFDAYWEMRRLSAYERSSFK